MSFESVAGQWTGTNDLWLEPGAPAAHSEATATIGGRALTYTWSWEGKPQAGVIQLTHDGAHWRDSWHQSEGVDCRPDGANGALMAVEYDYPAPEGPDWHWRIRVCLRPDDTLVVQMTNVTPWGEEAAAVQMALTRD